MIDPFEEYVVVYVLDQSGTYIGSKPYLAGDHISSPVLAGFKLSVDRLFGA
jgi:Uma2 family endonuclease